RPAFRKEEDMLLAANMVLAIHPFAATDSAFAFCCDDFLVTDKGAERLHKTPQEILLIGC
ncbi:MAG: aminopeptidase P family protein, partial [Deltaproteobacteria bacterium]|nr:aminopeptidase P family protein [Deltaproteobacteria bacterium]